MCWCWQTGNYDEAWVMRVMRCHHYCHHCCHPWSHPAPCVHTSSCDNNIHVSPCQAHSKYSSEQQECSQFVNSCVLQEGRVLNCSQDKKPPVCCRVSLIVYCPCVATCWPPLCLNIPDNHFVTLPIFEGHVSALSWQCRTVLLHIFCSFSPVAATDWSAGSEQNPTVWEHKKHV